MVRFELDSLTEISKLCPQVIADTTEYHHMFVVAARL